MTILVLAGAGASKAVNPKAYPTTVEFFANLPDEVKNEAFFSKIAEYLQAKTKSEIIDIEQWLWAAAEIRTFFQSASNRSTPSGWLLHNNRISGILGVSADVGPFLHVGQQANTRIESLENLVQQQVYSWYHREPELDELEATWIPLLKYLAKNGQPVEIFTTNYDLILEAAIEHGQLPIETGRSRGVLPRLQEEFWMDSSRQATNNRTGLLTKLHGSVDWSRGNGKIYCGTPLYRGNHKDHVIIYPGFKGVPTEKPFTLFHEHFLQTVGETTLVLAIGFAFRDEYINQMLRDQLPRDTKMIVINPDANLKTPLPDQQIKHIKKPFARDAIEAAIRVF